MGLGFCCKESRWPGPGQNAGVGWGYTVRERPIGGYLGSVACAPPSFLRKAGWLPAPVDTHLEERPKARPEWALSPRAFPRPALKE